MLKKNGGGEMTHDDRTCELESFTLLNPGFGMNPEHAFGDKQNQNKTIDESKNATTSL